MTAQISFDGKRLDRKLSVTALLNRPYPNEVPATLHVGVPGDGNLTIGIETENAIPLVLMLDRSALGKLLRAIADALVKENG